MKWISLLNSSFTTPWTLIPTPYMLRYAKRGGSQPWSAMYLPKQPSRGVSLVNFVHKIRSDLDRSRSITRRFGKLGDSFSHCSIWYSLASSSRKSLLIGFTNLINWRTTSLSPISFSRPWHTSSFQVKDIFREFSCSFSVVFSLCC